MPIIDTPAGTLEVTNAVLRASEFRATQKIGVANNAPTKNFSVGTIFHVDATSIDPVNITGNVVATGMKIGNLTINNGRLGEFYTGLIISREGSTIVGGDRAGSANGKARVWIGGERQL